MIERKHQTLRAVYVLNDIVATNLAMLVAFFLRFVVEVIPVTKGPQDLAMYLRILPLVTLVFPVAFQIQGLYRRRPVRSLAEEWVSVGIATLLGTVVLSGLLLWIRPGGDDAAYSRATLAMFGAFEIAFVMLGRMIVRLVAERRYREGRNLETVVIAGNGDLARAVADRIRAHQELGFRIVGYVADGDGVDMGGLPRLGAVSDTAGVIDTHEIDHVFVALPHASHGETTSLLESLVRHYVSIHVVPDLLQFMTLRSRVEDLDGLPTINLSETPLDGWSRVVKRGFDLTFGLAAFLALSPLMGLIALLIYLEDRGPVLYRQVRMGLDAIPFEIIKFRSMKVESESITGAVWAEKDDPRCTRIGRWLREWSLDELPQLWNVVRGDMSLVGPRPERPEFVRQFRSELPYYMLRHKVRAGMTGWAQVHGWRGNTSIHMRIEHDLYYIENWSLLLDMKILVLTLRHGFRHENAY